MNALLTVLDVLLGLLIPFALGLWVGASVPRPSDGGTP